MQVTETLYSRGYRLGPRIGKGSYAKVKIVERLSDSNIMASKIVSRRRAAKEFLDKFLPRELSVLLSLSHRNIIRVYEIVQTDELVCIIMEYASHGDLLDYIKKRAVLQEEEAGVLFAQICEGVSYLHNHNICHRDLKCENILLRRNMTIALSDFGFSRAHLTPETLSSTYCGSAAYASPELLRGTPYSPFQNDIWSLGCIVFIMVTGQMPFCDKNTKKMMYRQLKGKVNFPDNRIVSVTCKNLIANMLEPNTDLRYNIELVLSHPWLQRFAHLVDPIFMKKSEQTSINEDSNHSPTQQPSPAREIIQDSFTDPSSEVSKKATEQKDIWKQNSCNMLIKNSSIYSNDSTNDHFCSFMHGSQSLCRMPGEACLFCSAKERGLLFQNEDEVSENENQTLNMSSTSSDQRVPSESSIDANPSNSIVHSSTCIDHAVLPYMQLPVSKIYQNSRNKISRDSAIRTEDESTDKNFKIRIQQILHIPVSKTSNFRCFQDQQIPPSIKSRSCAAGKSFKQSQTSSYYSTSIDLPQSVSMTRLHQSEPQTDIHKFNFSTSESTAVVKQFKHDINVEQAHICQAGLVTQMRRIFESKNSSTSTNDTSQSK